MKTLIKLFFLNVCKALLIIAILAVYLIPLSYIVTSHVDHLTKGLLMFLWLVLWIIILVTAYQYFYKKQNGNENY